MPTRNQIILGLFGILIVAVIAWLATRSMGLGEYQAGEEGAPIAGDLADMTPGERLCAAQTTTDSIKSRIFNRAREAADGDTALLTRLETGTVARMERPRLVRFDDGLEEARCEGQLVLELPRGAEPAFSNNRRLTVNLVYYAEPSANGSTVSRMDGADGLIGRLATADLTARPPEDDFSLKPESMEGDDDGPTRDKDEDPPEEPDLEDEPPLPPPDSDNPPEDLLPPAMDGRRTR